MRAFVLGLVTLVALLVKATPLCWQGSVLDWMYDRSTDVHRSMGSSSTIVAKTPLAQSNEFSVVVTPISAPTNKWSSFGVVLGGGAEGSWRLEFVAEPQGGRRLSLYEIRKGVRNAEGSRGDNLRALGNRRSGRWEFCRSYRVLMILSGNGVSVKVTEADGGSEVYDFGYAFDDKPAVRVGRPSMSAWNGFVASFERGEREWSGEVSDPKPEEVRHPPYTGKSFVPGVASRATGFFRVEKMQDGRWWAIDPLGRGMIVLGLEHLNISGFRSRKTGRYPHLDAVLEKYGTRESWNEFGYARAEKWGFNFLGSGTGEAMMHRGMAHTILLGCGWGPAHQIDEEWWIHQGAGRPCTAFPNVFHRDFEAYCDEYARKVTVKHRNDPWLFGYFLDNELKWWDNEGGRFTAAGLFDVCLRRPTGHSARQAAERFAAEHAGEDIETIRVGFQRLVAEKYFSTFTKAIRRHDPNHLILGSRFAGISSAADVVWEACGKHCDVATVNVYPWADLDRGVVRASSGLKAPLIEDELARVHKLCGKPLLITEWSFPALDSGLPCTRGAGQRLQTQEQRAKATALFARVQLALPFMLGYDFFMFCDMPDSDPLTPECENTNYGLVNVKDEPYEPICRAFTTLNANAAKCRAMGLPKAHESRRPVLKASDYEQVLSVLCPAKGKARREKIADGGYRIVNDAGLVLEGREGGKKIFDRVLWKNFELGDFTAMVSWFREDGHPGWLNLNAVREANWCEKRDGSGTLTVKGTADSGSMRFEMEVACRVFGDRPEMFCECLSVKNVGRTPVQMRAIYLRPTRAEDDDPLSSCLCPPNVWNGGSCAAWYFGGEKPHWYGSCSFSPEVLEYNYLLMRHGEKLAPHADSSFAVVPEKLVLKPGETYRPQGTAYVVVATGEGGRVEFYDFYRTRIPPSQ